MLKLLKNRRSIRKYKEKKIEKEKIEQLVKAVLLSPSSRNLRPWEFIVVDDRDLLAILSQSKQHGSGFLQSAALGMVVIANAEKSDTWIEDSSIASIILHLTAETLGLGSCWIQIRGRQHNDSVTAEEYIRQTLNIPEKYKVESVIAIGYPDENKPPLDESQLQYNKVHLNSFGNPII
jgi:nitroreductase